MAQEIERKFLVINDDYKSLAERKTEISQGYLSRNPERTVRVRIVGDEGRLTVKGKNKGCVRLEFEYPIPVEDARQMLKLCEGRIISKTRWFVRGDDGLIWEVDEFKGELEPLVVAELELESPDRQFGRPGFVGQEVTGDPTYYNSML